MSEPSDRSVTIAKTILALIFSTSGLTAKADTAPQDFVYSLNDTSVMQILSVIVPGAKRAELSYLINQMELNHLTSDEAMRLEIIVTESIKQLAERSTNFV
jgi:hypothetical protein